MVGVAKYHEYDFLPAGSIRLITLQYTGPQTTTDRLAGPLYPLEQQLAINMETFEMKTCPQYVALSYTWGLPGTHADPQPSIFTQVERVYPIWCEANILLGTWNLRSALRRIRHFMEFQHNVHHVDGSSAALANDVTGGAHYVWVDAICINQQDLIERALHVQDMGQVYSQASKTLVWLGEQDIYSSDVMRAFGKVASNLEAARTSLSTAKSKLTRTEGVAVEPVLLDSTEMTACVALFNRRWFARNWITQEVALSKEVIVAIGSKVLSFNLLERARTLVQLAGYRVAGYDSKLEGADASKNIDLAYTNVRFLTYVDSVRAAMKNGKLPDFWLVMTMCRMQNCFDPRDKIYSILGVCSEFTANVTDRIVPSYTADIDQVYVQATKVVIDMRRDLLTLSLVSTENRSSNLPSWCPDYRRLQAVVNAYPNSPSTWQFPMLKEHSPRSCVNGLELTVFGQCIGNMRENIRLNFSGKRDIKRYETSWTSSGPAALCSLLTRLSTDTRDKLRLGLQNMSRVELAWRTLLRRFPSLLSDLAKERDPTRLPNGAGLLLPTLLRMMVFDHLSISWPVESEESYEKLVPKSELDYYIDATELAIAALKGLEPQNRHFLPPPGQIRDMYMQGDKVLVYEKAYRLSILDRKSRQKRAAELKLHLPESYAKDSAMELFPQSSESFNDTDISWTLGFYDGLVNTPVTYGFRTDNHLFGLVSCPLEEGDQIWILNGAHAPHVLRPLRNGKFRFLSETCMHGLMDGEAIPLCHNPVSIIIE